MKNIIYIFLISMLPLIELRGAIPVGAVLENDLYINFAAAVLGNLLPVPFILLFIPKILEFLSRFKPFRPIVSWLWRKAEKHSKKVIRDASDEGAAEATAADGERIANGRDGSSADGTVIAESVNEASAAAEQKEKKRTKILSAGTFIGLMTFVLLPIPGTGAWTGSLVAALFKLPPWRSFLAVTLGVIGCGIIMTLASYGIVGFLSFLA